MKALKVLRDGSDVCTELELTRYLHLIDLSRFFSDLN